MINSPKELLVRNCLFLLLLDQKNNTTSNTKFLRLAKIVFIINIKRVKTTQKKLLNKLIWSFHTSK